MVNVSFSLLLAAKRDLIKIVTLLSAYKGVVEVVGFKPSAPGAENFGFNDSPDKLLKGHAVVSEKASHACRGCAEDAEPTCCFFAENGAKAQINTHGNQNGQGRAQELPNGQAEEYRFLVTAYFFRDFYFYNVSLLLLCPKLGRIKFNRVFNLIAPHVPAGNGLPGKKLYAGYVTHKGDDFLPGDVRFFAVPLYGRYDELMDICGLPFRAAPDCQ